MSSKDVKEQLEAGMDAPSLDKKLNLVPRGTKFKTPAKPKTSEVTSEVLIKQILVIAAKFRTAKKLVEDNKQQILKLREMFGVSKGQAGKKLNIEGNLIYWETFVQEYFGITTRWMNELLGVKREPTGSTKKRDEEKPLYQKGYSVGRESVSNTEEVQKAIKDGINRKYEVQMVELEKKLKGNSVDYQSRLVRLLDEIEKVGEKVPVYLTQLAKKFREEIQGKAKSVAEQMEDAIADADTTAVESQMRNGWRILKRKKGYVVIDPTKAGNNTLAICKSLKEAEDAADAKKPEQSEAAQAAKA